VSLLERWLDDPARVRRIKRWFYAGLIAVVAAEVGLPLAFGGGHAHFAFERFPAWGSIWGLLSCVAIIAVSKLIGKAWLLRREDHYGD
jgi:hypothetical protein